MTLLLIIIYLAFISLGLPDSLLGSAWPSMYGGLNVSIESAGVISMIISAGTIVSSLLSEKVIRRFGTGITTCASVFMTAAALMGFSFSQSFVSLCLLAVPLGLGAGSVDAALNNFVALHYKAKHMSWLHSFWGVGASLGPVIMAFCLARFGSWNAGYISIGVIQLLLAAGLLFSLPLWKKKPTSVSEEEEAVSNINPPPFRKLIRLPGAAHVLITFLCYCGLESTVGLWGSTYLVTTRGVTEVTAAAWVSLYFFGITSGRFMSGFLSMKLSDRKMVAAGLLFISIGIGVLFLPFDGYVPLAGLFLIGLGCAPIYPSIIHETPANFGKLLSQSMIGLQMACAYVGSTFLPPLFGLIGAKTGYGLFPYYIGTLLILMLAMVFLRTRRR